MLLSPLGLIIVALFFLVPLKENNHHKSLQLLQNSAAHVLVPTRKDPKLCRVPALDIY